MFRSIAVICLATVFTGCATRPPLANGVLVDFEQSVIRAVTPIDQARKADVGQVIYSPGSIRAETLQTIAIDQPVSATLEDGHRLVLPAGATGALRWRSHDRSPAFCAGTTASVSASALLMGGLAAAISGPGASVMACLVDVDRNGAFDNVMFQQYERYFPLPSPVNYRIVSTRIREFDMRQGFRQELVYLGSGGGVLRLSYREFKDDMARPAFTQDLTYDLKVGATTEIGFRGMRARILSTSNSTIEYQIDRAMD